MTPRRAVALGAVALAIALVVAAYALARGNKDAVVGEPLAPDLAAAIGRARPASDPFTTWPETRLSIGGRCVRVIVAVTETQREEGLRAQRELGPYAGMLFVNAGDVRTAYTMSGTPLPLDLTLFDRTGRPVERHALGPCAGSITQCPVTRPSHDYRLALETPRDTQPVAPIGGCG